MEGIMFEEECARVGMNGPTGSKGIYYCPTGVLFLGS